MKVFPLVRSDGKVIAFEIEHAWVSRTHEISPTDNRKLICYGRLVACVATPNASQATIARCGEKRGAEVLKTLLLR
jgi:hypothetical protein